MREGPHLYICTVLYMTIHSTVYKADKKRKYPAHRPEIVNGLNFFFFLLHSILPNIFCLTYNDLKGQCHKNFVLTETRPYPTDMPEPLLTSVYCPFKLLQSFKDGVHLSKTDFILL